LAGPPAIVVDLYQGQNDGFADELSHNPAFRQNLTRLFGYSNYRQLGQARTSVTSGQPINLKPSDLFSIRIKPDSAEANVFDFELLQSDRPVLSARYTPKPGIPLIIKGPLYQNGVLILVLNTYNKSPSGAGFSTAIHRSVISIAPRREKAQIFRMTLSEQIDIQLKDAMRAKDLDKANVLRMLKSGVKYLVIEKYGPEGTATDDEVMQVARKEIKKRVESIESFEKAGRADVAAKEKLEKTLLETFLPAGLSDSELEQIVRQAIADTGATAKAQMGLVMKAAVAKAAGRADGKQINALVSKLLP